MAAFRRALELGADMIELDVRLTRDGVPVVIHDETLSRTTDGEGSVGETAFSDLRRLSAGAWFDPRFREERVPRLAEVFDLAGTRAAINVEIKAQPGRPEVPPEVPSEARADFDHAARADSEKARADSRHVETALAAWRVVREAGATRRALFSSFDPKPLTVLRGEGEDTRLALLTGPSSLPALFKDGGPSAARAVLARMERWRGLRLEAACVHRRLVSAPLVMELHARGWAVNVYTVDEETAAERLDAMGVDAIFTNDPGRMLRRWPPAGARLSF